jgi:intein/homing endonuclease
MILKIENLKKSERGIEVTGWIPTPHRDMSVMPDVPRSASIEERNVLLAPYYASRKEANKEYMVAKREFERLHLGDADLLQAQEEPGDNE